VLYLFRTSRKDFLKLKKKIPIDDKTCDLIVYGMLKQG